MRIALSGVGAIGIAHAQAFRSLPGVSLIAHDPVATPEEISAQVGPGVEVASTFEQLLDRVPDGIVVAGPDAVHVEQTSQARARGIAVLVEKPLAPSAELARELAGTEASAEPGAKAEAPVLVGYVLHHYACMARAAELLASGAIGEPISFHAQLGAYETLPQARNRFNQAETDVLYVDYSHEWDYLRWLLGPVAGGFAVAREAGDLPYSQRPNVIDVVLRMKSGVTGTAHLDYVQQPTRREFMIIGDRGTIHVDVIARLVRLSPWGGRSAVDETYPQSRTETLMSQAQHFLDVVAGRAEPCVSVHDAIAALEVADALRSSAGSGQWEELPTA